MSVTTAPDVAGVRTEAGYWGSAGRGLFRFVFAYLVLYILPTPPGVVTWASAHLLGLAVADRHGGSGDTAFHYVRVACIAVSAAVVAVAWSLLDRRGQGYPRLLAGLRLVVRFYLAQAMVGYGAVKVFKSQFPMPPIDRLLQPIGDSSPMGLLWTFMGVSGGYNAFAGAVEIVGGLLLTFRRTTLLGALIAGATLVHVLVLNLCYDVPVKLFTANLLLMAGFLIAPDLRRLVDLFILGRGAGPVECRPLFGRRWPDRAAVALRTALVAACLASALLAAHRLREGDAEHAPRPPYFGAWSVDELEVDGRAIPPRPGDAARWRRFVFNVPGALVIQLMDGSRVRHGLRLNPTAKSLALTRRDEPAWGAALTYREPAPGFLEVEGSYDGRVVRARLRREDGPRFPLLERGFHWISEAPYYR